MFITIVCYMLCCRSSLKCSIVDHIQNRELPEGGLQDLQSAVLRDLPWANGLPSAMVDKETYRRQMSVLISGMYVLAPQGRIEALTTLTLTAAHQALQLSSGSCALSNTFKTYEKYGYQPISMPPEMHGALEAYLKLRIGRRLCSNVFFVDYEGNDYDSTKLGHLVTQYFKLTMGLHVTTTMIRALWEIMADKAYKASAISMEQRSAIMNINGHSSQTTKDYYLREAREQDARHGVEVCEAILQHDVQLLCTEDRKTAVNSKYAWGTEHPSYHVTTAARVQWTDFEKNFVVNWCKQIVATNSELEYKVVRMCLDHIKTDPTLIAKFHMHHTLDGTRLGYPWKEFKKLERRSAMLVAAGAAEFI